MYKNKPWLRAYIDQNYHHPIFYSPNATQKAREQYVSHPINSLGIFKRMGYDFENRLNNSESSDHGEFDDRTNFLVDKWPQEGTVKHI